MKNFIKHIPMVLLAVLSFTACETTDLDLQVSPNDLSPTAGDPNLLLNSVQLAYITNQQTLADRAAELTRIDYFGNRNYFNGLPGNTLNGVWSRTYSSGGNGAGDFVNVGILTNLQALENIDAGSDIDYSFHVAVAKTLYAHSLFQLVDFLGSATYTEAGQPLEFPAPNLDSGESVYDAAFVLLNEAESLFNADPETLGAQDFFYSGESEKWIKLINTLRLRSYKNTGNTSAFNAIVDAGNYIMDSEDDFQISYGTSELQPDDRHPDYATDYTASGANIYQSNWMMETMLENEDPRIRYYFYRQVDGTPGALDVDGDPVDANEETLACSFVTPPQHYIDGGYTYCSVDNGYWGRSHGNDEGTPPDNFTRTAVGVYPAGGLFDDSRFEGVGLGLGGGGAGIEPIILASYVDFWIGEMATTDTDKAEALRSGLEKSIAKVQTFGSLDGSADLSMAPTEEEVADYIDDTVADFLAASGDDQENIFAEQYFTTLFGGATEAYNYYRKTGYPTTLLPNWEPDPGAFPRSFLLPQNEVLNNPNLTQKDNLEGQVFWDTNPASPAFPPAN